MDNSKRPTDLKSSDINQVFLKVHEISLEIILRRLMCKNEITSNITLVRAHRHPGLWGWGWGVGGALGGQESWWRGRIGRRQAGVPSYRRYHHKVPKSLKIDKPEIQKGCGVCVCVCSSAYEAWTWDSGQSVLRCNRAASTAPVGQCWGLLSSCPGDPNGGHDVCTGNGWTDWSCVGRGGRGSRHRERGACWVTGECPLGNTLCQHVPETAATQCCPAASQAGVRAVVPPPVLHHIHWADAKKKKRENRGQLVFSFTAQNSGALQHGVSPGCVYTWHVTFAMHATAFNNTHSSFSTSNRMAACSPVSTCYLLGPWPPKQRRCEQRNLPLFVLMITDGQTRCSGLHWHFNIIPLLQLQYLKLV